MKEPLRPFVGRAQRLAIAAAAASLLFGAVYVVFEEDLGLVRSNGADGFSGSAIGHKAFLEVVASQGLAVRQSRFRSAERTGNEDVLVVLEPDEVPEMEVEEGEEDEELESYRSLAGAKRLVLVLPRWRPADGDRGAGHLKQIEEIPLEEVDDFVEPLVQDAQLVRLDHAPEWTENVFGLTPELDRPQLLAPGTMQPLLACDEGILVGEWTRDDVHALVVADPTPFQNHGIWRGDHASLCLSWMDAVRGPRGVVVVDEVLHGYELVPSALREAFRRPTLWVSLHLLALLALVGWAATARFGRPLAAPGGLAAGKEALIDNTAELLDVIGALPSTLRRYFAATLDRMLAARHAPRSLTWSASIAWLETRLPGERAAELRALATTVEDAELPRRDGAALVALGGRIHRFRTEVLDGAR